MKVGDYVRTENGLIAKYIGYNNEFKWHLFDGKIQWYYEYYRDDIDDDDWEEFKKEDVIKSSPNIIDLIEPGDYVNGYKVLFAGATTWDNDGNVIDKRVKINYDGYDRWLSEDFIKSIVTREQFESMEYKICTKEGDK